MVPLRLLTLPAVSLALALSAAPALAAGPTPGTSWQGTTDSGATILALSAVVPQTCTGQEGTSCAPISDASGFAVSGDTASGTVQNGPTAVQLSMKFASATQGAGTIVTSREEPNAPGGPATCT